MDNTINNLFINAISKEMVYQADRKCEVLHSGEYKGYKFAIVNLGTHPTAYVENKNSYASYDEANEKTNYCPHGGFTYLDSAYWNKNDTSDYLGWDYAHCGDYMGYYGNDSAIIILGDKKWTTEEIFKEVKNVINKLIEIKE